jgi:hypothetical protein
MRKRADGRTRCGIPHYGERGDVEAVYSFAVMASKIAASIPAGTLSLSALCRTIVAADEMHAVR